jgi:hypothetical protein
MMTGWLEVHRAKLTARDDALIYLKETVSGIGAKLGRETFQDLRDQPFHDASTRQCAYLEVGPLLLTSSLSNALILKAVKGKTKWIDANCCR